MTYREQLKKERPEWNARKVVDYCMRWCPPDVDAGAQEPEYCTGENMSSCMRCWGRTIPETKENIE